MEVKKTSCFDFYRSLDSLKDFINTETDKIISVAKSIFETISSYAQNFYHSYFASTEALQQPMRPLDCSEDRFDLIEETLSTSLSKLRKFGFFDGTMDSFMQAAFKQIHHLKIECYINPPLNDSELQKLIEACPNLTSLSLDCFNTAITDEGLKYLKNLPNLTKLKLTGCKKATDAGLCSLECLTKLTALGLNDWKQITNDGLKYLKKISNLTHLYIAGCPNITDEGLEHLYSLPLQHIHVDMAGAIDFEKLKTRIPTLTYRPLTAEMSE